jgi:hypothetical protein
MKIAILSDFSQNINKMLLESLLSLDTESIFTIFCQETVDIINPRISFVIQKDM